MLQGAQCRQVRSTPKCPTLPLLTLCGQGQAVSQRGPQSPRVYGEHCAMLLAGAGFHEQYRTELGMGVTLYSPALALLLWSFVHPGPWASLEAKPKMGSQHLASCTHWPMGSVLQPGLDPGVGGDPTTK